MLEIFHVKTVTVVLHHSQACSKPTNDVIDCLREMLQELLQACESRELKQFNEPRINLLSGYGDCDIQKISTRRLIKVLGFSHDCNYFEKFIESLPKGKNVEHCRRRPGTTWNKSDRNRILMYCKKVQVGKDQEKAQSEKDSHSKNRGGKKTNLQSGTYTMKHIVSRMSSYFPNRWPLSYLNLT